MRPLRAAMHDETNELVVSAASIWKIAIKRAIGKLRFDRPIVATVLALGFEISSGHWGPCGVRWWAPASP
jgi:PIN domain nuclease of toxin-antitoxin system